MKGYLVLGILGLAAVVVFGLAAQSYGEIVVLHHYRLGDADPGAVAGTTGADPTVDSVGGADLPRTGSPDYISSGAPSDGLAMNFNNIYGTFNDPGQAQDHYTDAIDVTPTDANNWGFETWFKFDSVPNLDTSDGREPDDSEAAVVHIGNWSGSSGTVYTPGLGLVVKTLNGTLVVESPGVSYVTVSNSLPDFVDTWNHLAVVNEAGTLNIYLNGDSTPANSITFGAFDPGEGVTIGAHVLNGLAGADIARGMDGAVAELRIFEFEAGEFETSDLLYPAVPEPTSFVLLAMAAGGLLFWRRR